MILRRLLVATLIAFLAVSTVFFVTHGIGDPAIANLGPRANAEQLDAFRREHDLPPPLRTEGMGLAEAAAARAAFALDLGGAYLRYLGGLAALDLGRSYRDDRPVTDLLASRLPRTVLLGVVTLLFELLLGLSIGIFAALRRNTAWDTGTLALAFLGISAPSYLTGLIFLDVFAFRLGWFPVGGYGVGALEHLRHVVLPALTLAILGAATYARVMRSEMIEVLGEDYVRTARAKGLSGSRVVFAHAVRNALVPIVTLVGLSLPLLVSGAIITEFIFSWPGMGRLAVEAIDALDVPTIMGIVVVGALTVVVGNLIADVAVALLDPRVGSAGLPTHR
ncbi:MAG: ABC transporter permease [Sandaracinaceae bacterium]